MTIKKLLNTKLCADKFTVPFVSRFHSLVKLEEGSGIRRQNNEEKLKISICERLPKRVYKMHGRNLNFRYCFSAVEVLVSSCYNLSHHFLIVSFLSGIFQD